jgi:hypothetical protein
MISWTQAEQDILNDGNVLIRRYMILNAKNRSTGVLEKFGFWSGSKHITQPIIPLGAENSITVTFKGAGNFIEIDPIIKSAGLSARSLKIKLSGASSDVDQAIREYDVSNQRVEIFKSLANPVTGVNAGPIRSDYYGKVAEISHTDTGSMQTQIELTCYTLFQDLQFSSTGARTDAFQKLRDPNDNGRKHVATVGSWELQWGGSA